MFSSTSSNPFQPYFPFSSSNLNYNHQSPPPPPPPPCVNQEPCTGDLFLHQNIHDPLSGQFSLHCNHALMAPSQTLTHLGVPSSNTISPNDSLSSCGDDHQQYRNHYGALDNGNIPYFLHSSREEEDTVAPSKKDRHSKIFTAQGLRDRRVRLSINVAREFFDLQDLLGFDRASKTLEWLLTKSKRAIKQLGTGNKHLTCSTSTRRSKSLSSSSDGDDNVSAINEVENHVVSLRKLKEFESAVHVVAKESRAKARTRARERTREKLMCTATRRPQILINQLRSLNELDDHHQPNCETTISSLNVADHHMNQELSSLLANQLAHHHHEEDQSVHVIKRNKLKQISSVYSNYNQKKYLNVISAEGTDRSPNSHIQFPNASQNWDINDAFPCPSIN